MSNHLSKETSPYLLQHAENPVDWYPWSDEAFEKAQSEDKPIFLSIGYSTCHWCHVMAHESFEDDEVADILNKDFVAIKVDREERPDIDSIYMAVCQAFTGSGGWPTTIFMTYDKKPFYAGTYFPKTSTGAYPGLIEILTIISEKWRTNRKSILKDADEITRSLNKAHGTQHTVDLSNPSMEIIEDALSIYEDNYDPEFGGFGRAPKFPAAHNLMFLISYYERTGNKNCLRMVETTLHQMFKGGMFDHIGYGFCRYSTDKYFLVPHFEKMLYDNALLIMAYCRAYKATKDEFYISVAQKVAMYIIHEMQSQDGAFYSAQDADSEGEEGKYYVFDEEEIQSILGKEVGEKFNNYYDITKEGNFEGYSIPNLLKTDEITEEFEKHLPKIYEYRKNRYSLHLDDKILLSWNSLMICAMCYLYRVTTKVEYLNAALKADEFIKSNLSSNDELFVSYRDGKKGTSGFLEDYANYIFALTSLYESTMRIEYLKQAQEYLNITIKEFYDEENGGFFLYGNHHEDHIFRPKEVYDGAMPSGNSMMAYNLVKLYNISHDEKLEKILQQHLKFVYHEAKSYPPGYSVALMAILEYLEPTEKITAVLHNPEGIADIADLPIKVPLRTAINIITEPTDDYKLLNNITTYYVCKGHTCLPPSNKMPSV